MTATPPPPPRTVEVQNRHPRLTVPVPAVRRAVGILDGNFRILPADLPAFAPARARVLRSTLGQSGIGKPKAETASACPPGELSLVFLTDADLAQLHGDFMADPTPTDVITFEGDAAAGLAGEICVSADTAARHVGLREGAAAPRSRLNPRARPAAFAAELTLYLVHGWLHLAGYDDLAPARKRRMRAAEARAMRLLAARAAIPAFRLR